MTESAVVRRGGAIAIAVVLGTALLGYGQNRVANPGFEDGSIQPWRGDGTVTSTEAHSGTQAAVVDGEISVDLGGLEASSVTELSFWSKGRELYDPQTGLGFSWISVGLLDPDQGFIPGAIPIEHMTLEWTRYTVEVSHHGGCYLMGVTVGGQCYLDDVTLIADGPPLEPGDANTDGDVDLEDFEVLRVNFQAGHVWSQGDFDFDQDVDLDDFVILKRNFGARTVRAAAADQATARAAPPSAPGDADLDGDVDMDDFARLQANFATGTRWAHGDFDRDGDVDLLDFVILKHNFGRGGDPTLDDESHTRHSLRGLVPSLGRGASRLSRRGATGLRRAAAPLHRNPPRLSSHRHQDESQGQAFSPDAGPPRLDLPRPGQPGDLTAP